MADKDFSRYGLRGVRGALALAISLVCAFPTVAQAQIRTDGTLGRPAVALVGPSFQISEALGRLAGSNLFYSFLVFNVGQGESATFITTTAGLANVISRVTGGSASQINGPVSLHSTNAAPNFFFINPAGVVFGQGAQIDVPAGFNVSTANYLKFPDGNFYADPKAVSTLSSAAPEAFGFLGTTRAAVTINNNADLGTPNTPFQIVAGDVTVDHATLQDQAGDVRVIAVGGGPAEIGMTGTSTLASGTLTLSNGGSLTTLSAGAIPAGNITVAAGTISISGAGSGIYSSNPAGATARAGNIDVLATQDLSIVNAGAISTTTSSSGDAGSVAVSAAGLTIDSQGNSAFATAIGSEAGPGSTGNAGAVQVTVAGQASIVNGGTISSNTFASGNAGTVAVSAGSLTIDGKGSAVITGITSAATPRSTGNAGSVQVTVADQASIVNGGEISSNTFERGNAGTVAVSAGSLNISSQNSAISSEAGSGSTGNAGSVQVTVAGQTSIVNGGAISSSTFGAGNAGTVKVSAGSLTIDEQGSSLFTGIASAATHESTGNAGSIEVTVAGQASIVNGGEISSATFASGSGGMVAVSAGSLIIDSQGNSVLPTGILSATAIGAMGDAGLVQVTVAGQASILNGGVISSDTFASGKAGTVAVSAGSLTIDGQGSAFSTAITSAADPGSRGNAGSVQVTVAGQASIVNGGVIDSSTAASGKAGTVALSAGSLTIDRQGSQLLTGIVSAAIPGSTGDAGSVQVAVAGRASIVNGGKISSSTVASGNAGTVAVSAGSLTIDGQGSASSTGIFSTAAAGLTGNAGSVQLTVAGQGSIVNGGAISSSTFGAGSAGTVAVSAGSLSIDSQGNSAQSTGIFSVAGAGSTGNAGAVQVTVAGQASIVNGGAIASSTFGLGNAGTVKISAGSLTIDGQGSSFFTGIANQAAPGSTGNAGSVQVTVVGQASILNGSEINSNTFGPGNAGTVKVAAESLTVDGSSSGIRAAATAGSSGQTGDITVSASNSITLSNGGTISIENDATVPNPAALVPTLLSVSAPTISLTNASITAASTGNVAASDIHIDFAKQMVLDSSVITTSANTGNGGAIVTKGGGPLLLNNSQITTSVTSPTNGNGGDITISAPSLVMNTGFIQANTAAVNASGGKVTIDVDALVPSGSTLFVGGQTAFTFAPGVFGFNVIQAAAPTGVSGTIQISTPVLDIIGSISALPAVFLDSGGLGRSPCAIVGGSSLSQVGRGGLPPRAGDLLWIDPGFEVPATPPTGAPGSGTVVPPHRTAGSNVTSKTNPCWN